MSEMTKPIESTRNGLYPWHEQSWQHFIKARQSSHLPHALLFSGEENTGKRGFADKIIKSLLCEAPQLANAQGACNQCHGCKTYDSSANPDYLHIDLLDDKQQIVVDQIRAMNAFLGLTRSFNGQRVVLISQAERMNLNAANSLLKSLEEPADNSVIILLSAKASSLLATIKSRCQLLHLTTPDKQQAIAWLRTQKQVADQQPEDLEQALEISQGRPLAALNVLTSKINVIQSRADFLKDISEILQQHVSITDIAKKWHKQDRESLLNWQLGWVKQLLQTHHLQSKRLIKSNHTLLMIEENVLPVKLWDLYDQLLRQKQLVHTSVNPQIFLENMLVLWLQTKRC